VTATRATAKQTIEKSVPIKVCVVGWMVRCGVLLLLFFYFKTGANKLVNLKGRLKVALGELLVNLIARISVPNEPRDLYKKPTTSSESGIASL
jgi:hypothetical protein